LQSVLFRTSPFHIQHSASPFLKEDLNRHTCEVWMHLHSSWKRLFPRLRFVTRAASTPVIRLALNRQR
jgi:hypothetical protein